MKSIAAVKTVLILVFGTLAIGFMTATIILAIRWNNPNAVAERNITFIRRKIQAYKLSADYSHDNNAKDD